MMPLCFCNVGEENTIKKIGGSPEVKKHLENLGFVVGGNRECQGSAGRDKRGNGAEDNGMMAQLAPEI